MLTSINQFENRDISFQQNQLLTYKNQFGEHDLTLLAGFETTSREYTEMSASARSSLSNPLGQIPNNPRFWYMNTDFVDSTTKSVNSGQYKTRNVSYFGRMLYNFSNKYLLNASIRNDGSSALAPGNRFDWFWSVGAAWEVTRENFMKEIDFLNYFKVKGSYGDLGNQYTPYNYFGYPIYVEGGTGVFNGNLYPAFVKQWEEADDLGWEHLKSYEFGFESMMLNRRLSFDATYYNKKTEDLLNYVPGNPNFFLNAGSIESKGFEFTLGWKDNFNENFSYYINGNLSTAKTKVLNTLESGYQVFYGPSIYKEGLPMGAFYGYIVAGLYQSYADILGSPASTSGDTSAGTLVNIAEAKTIRAYCYFQLRRDFGEVPVNLKTIDVPQDEVAPKNSIAEVDAQIISDLTSAKEVLPVQWPSAYRGCATIGVANTILAKLYMIQKNWAKASEHAMEVINSGVYMLNPSYDAEFTKAGNNSTESIFEVQKTFDYPTKYSNNYYESQGVRGSGTWDLGWGFNVPSTNLVAAYEVGDLRKKTTILTSGGPDIYNTPGLVLPDSPPLAQKYWNGKAYTLPAERQQYAENKNHWENIKFFRYADILLIAAEAANELGQISTATNYVNMVRSRAGLPGTTASNQGTMRDAIKHERRIEFAMEAERFYDLVRWGDANTVLAPFGYADRNKVFPIPQEAIDKAQGVLVQNPNY